MGAPNKLQAIYPKKDLRFIYLSPLLNGRLVVSIRQDGLNLYIGTYSTINKAIRARNYALRGQGFIPSCNIQGRNIAYLR